MIPLPPYSLVTVGFESYDMGSWSEVEVKHYLKNMFLINFKDADKEEQWVPISEIRLRCRLADDWDCFSLKKGRDVSIVSMHPHSTQLDLKLEAVYDARLSSVNSMRHKPGKCCCKFLVQFYSIDTKTYCDGVPLERRLLTNVPAIEVPISSIRILQQLPKTTPVEVIVEAHRRQVKVPWHVVYEDAFFLSDTDLPEKRESYDDESNVGSARKDKFYNRGSPASPRDGTKNGDKESNTQAGGEDQKTGPGFNHFCDPVRGGEHQPCKSVPDELNSERQDFVDSLGQKNPLNINIKRHFVDNHSEDSQGETRSQAKKRGRPKKDKYQTACRTEKRVPLREKVLKATRERTAREKAAGRLEKTVYQDVPIKTSVRIYSTPNIKLEAGFGQNSRKMSFKPTDMQFEEDGDNNLEPSDTPIDESSSSGSDWSPGPSGKNFHPRSISTRTRNHSTPGMPHMSGMDGQVQSRERERGIPRRHDSIPRRHDGRSRFEGVYTNGQPTRLQLPFCTPGDTLTRVSQPYCNLGETPSRVPLPFCNPRDTSGRVSLPFCNSGDTPARVPLPFCNSVDTPVRVPLPFCNSGDNPGRLPLPYCDSGDISGRMFESVPDLEINIDQD